MVTADVMSVGSGLGCEEMVGVKVSAGQMMRWIYQTLGTILAGHHKQMGRARMVESVPDKLFCYPQDVNLSLVQQTLPMLTITQ